MASTKILSDNGASSGSSGIKVDGGNDGVLILQTTTAGGTATDAVTINASQQVTFAQAANLPNTFGFKNRIINGAMVIDQRNAGAAITVSTNVYPLDRWLADEGGMNAFTAQQSTTAPTGFKNSLKCTMGTAVTIDATDYAYLRQAIEGYNVYDLNLGSASSSAFTLSFWVQSSVTGTFGVSFRNNASNATWCSTYVISSANTWEYKTVTVAAGAINSGTWTTDNTAGLAVFWDLGVGSTYSGTANQLNTGSNYFGVTGTTKLAATTGATMYITGVQLEKGSTATSFDFRDYGRELMMCQRYFIGNKSTAFVSPTIAANLNRAPLPYNIVSMRTTPTYTFFDSAGNSGFVSEFSSGTQFTVSTYSANASGAGYMQSPSSFTTAPEIRFWASAEL